MRRFFHGQPNVSPSLQHPTHHHDPTPLAHISSHLSRACLQLCKRIGAHQVFDESSDSLSRPSLLAGKTIHGQGLKLGISSKGLLGNAVVDLYAKCGDLGLARNSFLRLETKDVFSWNSMLSLYSKLGFLEHVPELFLSLRSSGVSPNGFTFAMVLSACSKLKYIVFGRKIHCEIIKTGFESDSYCEGAIIDMYSKCEKMTEARKFFDSANKTDTVSWTAMVLGYIQVNLTEQAIEVFEEMNRFGLEPDRVLYVTLISACIGAKKLDLAREFFLEMPNKNVLAWNLMISGHSKAGYSNEALTFFVEMRTACVKPTRSTLGSVLSSIASLRDLGYGKTVHSHAVKQGLDSNFYVGSSLINMYAKCERVGDSKRVFDSLDRKNSILWNAMLGGYAKNRYAIEVMKLFAEMKESGAEPSEFTYTSVLSACSCLESLESGRQFHSVIIKNKFSSNLFVSNALIDMYAKSGSLSDARKQFERMKSRDEVSWNAIIVGYVLEGYETEAFDLFRRMVFNGTMPGEVTLASLLSACGNSQRKGQQFHCLSVKSGLDTCLYSGSSLVDVYSKCGDIESARKVFDFMPIRSVVSMNSLISGYVLAKNLEKATSLFRDILASGLSPSDITFASVLDGCDRPDSIPLGRAIHGVVSKRGLLFGEDCEFLRVSLLCMYMNCRRESEAGVLFSEFPKPRSEVLWTSMISGLTQNGLSDKALDFYREMRRDDAKPDQATFASALRASALSSSLAHGREIHSLVFKTGFDRDELTSSAMVDMYAKSGDVKSSVKVFGEMRTKNDVVSWNSMIVGLAKNGFAEEAIRVFDEMKRRKIEPDEVTFLGILTACSHAGMVLEGRRIFKAMAEKIRPRADHIASMVDLFGRWGFLKEAEEFIELTKFGSDPMIWSTFLGSCRLHGDESRGRRAAERLIELDPKSSSPYVLLSNIYAASGEFGKVDFLRAEMREKGVAKFPGCSWVVVGQTNHVFVAGDCSHSNVDEIRGILGCLVGIMKDSDSDSLLLVEEAEE